MVVEWVVRRAVRWLRGLYGGVWVRWRGDGRGDDDDGAGKGVTGKANSVAVSQRVEARMDGCTE